MRHAGTTLKHTRFASEHLLGDLNYQGKILNASRASLQIVKGDIEKASGQPFYMLLTNLSHNHVSIPNHVIIAQRYKSHTLLPQPRFLF